MATTKKIKPVAFERAPWIRGYKGLYKILPDGNILSFLRTPEGKVLVPRQSGGGYLTVTLSKNNKKSQEYVHRLIAQHFLVNPNPNKYKMVIHQDGNVTNNSVVNLKWTDGPGKLQQSLKVKKMVTLTISEKKLVDIVKMLKTSDKKIQWNSISNRFKINRNTLFRLRQSDSFKKLMGESAS